MEGAEGREGGKVGMGMGKEGRRAKFGNSSMAVGDRRP